MTRKRALETQHRDFRLLRLSRVGRSVILTLATLLSFAAIGLIATDHLLQLDTFRVDQLRIEGRFIYLKPQDIEKVVKQETLGNFFSVEINQIKKVVESLDWVQHADVRREWPDSLLITVTENVPIMRWNKSQWLNSHGEVISVPKFTALVDPVKLLGTDKDSQRMLKQAMVWKRALQELGLRLQQLSLSASQSWQLNLLDVINEYDFDVVLGSNDFEQRFKLFLSIYQNQFKQSEMQLQRVDMRYPDGLAVKSISLPRKPHQVADIN